MTYSADSPLKRVEPTHRSLLILEIEYSFLSISLFASNYYSESQIYYESYGNSQL